MYSEQHTIAKKRNEKPGFMLALVAISLIILTVLGVGVLTVGYGARLQAIRTEAEAVGMLAAEAGYEKAIFWMSQQKDMLSTLQQSSQDLTSTIQFPGGYCNYQIQLYSFVGSRPIYKVVSNGYSGKFCRTVDVFVMQAASGWDMGMCRILAGGDDTIEVYFADEEIIGLPIHINNLNDNPDKRDIYIQGSPQFLQPVAMGESRYTDGGSDKYSSTFSLFEGGIYFDQPDSRITDEDSIKSKVSRFKNSTKPQFRFMPSASSSVPDRHAAVQLEFFVENSAGKVRITNNCTVRGYQRDKNSKTYDFRIKPGTDGEKSERYDIYAYHFMPKDAEKNGYRLTQAIEQTYVSQSFGGVQSEPGGQIFVDGDVVIGGDMTSQNGDQVIKGKITVVATGNIWVADSIVLDGVHGADGMPAMDNPNILGLIAQGVVKVVDPGISEYSEGGTNDYPGPPGSLTGLEYVPIGRQDDGQWIVTGKGKKQTKEWQEAEIYERHLPESVIVEAAITVGGGGWGAENVQRDSYGGRKEYDNDPDILIVRGTITEAMRGVVGLIGKDGFIKQYYMDERLLEGLLPGDMWLRGKYIPAPAGWHDYRAK